MERSTPEQLLREYGEHARLVVYIAAAPGAGKTRRLLTDGHRLATSGKKVVIGWVETKDRPDLERLAEGLPRIAPRLAIVGSQQFPEFDFEAALAAKPDVVILDELAHDNLGQTANSKRWQDANALRNSGRSRCLARSTSRISKRSRQRRRHYSRISDSRDRSAGVSEICRRGDRDRRLARSHSRALAVRARSFVTTISHAPNTARSKSRRSSVLRELLCARSTT